jgi:hypothetical protein
MTVKGESTSVRLWVACGYAGLIGGAIFGFVRGLQHLPTLPFAIVEGAMLFGVPAFILGMFLAAGWSLGALVRRHFVSAG